MTSTQIPAKTVSIPSKTVERLAQWIDRELAFWDWLPTAQSYSYAHGYSPQRWGDYAELARIRDRLKELFPADPVPSEIHAAVKELYAIGALVHSGSAEATFVMKLKERDSEVAFAAFTYLAGRPEGVERAKSVDGMISAILFANGYAANAESERAALRHLHDEWSAEFDHQHERATSRFDELAVQTEAQAAQQKRIALKVLRRVRARVTKARTRFSSLEADFQTFTTGARADERSRVEQFARTVEEKLADAEARLAAITAAYTEQMALKSPVEYWSENRKFHADSAKRYLGWLSIVGPLALLGVGGSGWFLLGQEREPAWGKMIFFFVLTGLIVWVLRILVRLYLEHLHLQTDANERIVMAKTYLALRSEGVQAGDTEVTIVFNSLFRPTIRGAQDEAVPTTALDLLGKMVNPGK